MKNLFLYAAVFAVSLAPNFGWAHGEDKPGPHGGIIRMPGAFHTEIVPLDSRSFEIYLLDFSFKNPVVAHSTVQASVVSGEKRSALSCAVDGQRYRCTGEDADALTTGELRVTATRDGVVGVEAKYQLPLKR